MVLKAVPCLRRLFAGLSQQTPGFYPRSVRMRSVEDIVTLGQVFLRVFPFPFHNFPLLLHLQFAVSKIGDHWVAKILYTFSNPFDESRHILKGCSNYWCSVLLIHLCSSVKWNWDGDCRLWICLTSCTCAVSWRMYKYSKGQTNATVDC